MPASPQEEAQAAAELADQALAVMAKLKVGSWESAQSLALTSIAKSLAVLAQQASQR